MLSVIGPAPRDLWRTLVDRDEHALVFQTPEWIDAICATGPYENTTTLYTLPDGRPLVLPMVRRRGPFSMQWSMPFRWGFGGPVAPDLRPDDVSALLGSLRSGRRTSIRPNPLVAPIWDAARLEGVQRTERVAHTLDMHGGMDAVWKRFNEMARRNVRKAQKNDLVVEGDTTGRLLAPFYDLYMKTVERWKVTAPPSRIARLRGSDHDSLPKLEAVAQWLGDACRIWIAWHGDVPVAGVIVLLQGQNASYWRGAMDKDLAGPLRATHLLHHHAIADAYEAGCRYYHTGETGSDSLAQFKHSLGCEPYPFAEYRVERLPFTPLQRQVSRLLAAARG